MVAWEKQREWTDCKGSTWELLGWWKYLDWGVEYRTVDVSQQSHTVRGWEFYCVNYLSELDFENKISFPQGLALEIHFNPYLSGRVGGKKEKGRTSRCCAWRAYRRYSVLCSSSTSPSVISFSRLWVGISVLITWLDLSFSFSTKPRRFQLLA